MPSNNPLTDKDLNDDDDDDTNNDHDNDNEDHVKFKARTLASNANTNHYHHHYQQQQPQQQQQLQLNEEQEGEGGEEEEERRQTTSSRSQKKDSSSNKKNTSQQQQQQQSLAVLFPIGTSAKRELRNVFIKKKANNDNNNMMKDPKEMIHEFQLSHSLHTMIAKAYNTTPKYNNIYQTTTTTKSSSNSNHQPKNKDNDNNSKDNDRHMDDDNDDDNNDIIQEEEEEPLDTDCVMKFLSHLGVSQYTVHKRITDTLIHELCEAIRNYHPTPLLSSSSSSLLLTKKVDSDITTTSSAAADSNSNNHNNRLYDLLKSSWVYTTTIPELRPILWSILKQLNDNTPPQVVLALIERNHQQPQLQQQQQRGAAGGGGGGRNTKKDGDNNRTTTVTTSEQQVLDNSSSNNNRPETFQHHHHFQLLPRIALKHAEIYKPLPISLKQLCWEVDYDHSLPSDYAMVPKHPQDYIETVQTTLLYDTIQSDIYDYVTNPTLCYIANHPYDQHQRRLLHSTTQRRALTKGTTITTTNTTTTTTTQPQIKQQQQQQQLTTGKAISHLRYLLSSGGSSSSSSSGAGGTSSSTSHTTNATGSKGTVGGVATTTTTMTTYRPKLLYATISILMAKYCTTTTTNMIHDHNIPRSNTTMCLMGGAQHLYCTLLADLLLVSSGLPKAYNDVFTLARILDDVVQETTISDSNLIKIQTQLKLIFQPDQINDNNTIATAGNESKHPTKSVFQSSDTDLAGATTTPMNNSIQRQLNRIILTGIVTMKECDPQQLFLNPVTDEIAPGYSAIIKQPMSIGTMEQKLKSNTYHTINEWENDVKIMFKNCIDYNRGTAGQWFRNEANRQSKIYREEILPKAKRLYQNEIAKRNFIFSSTNTTTTNNNNNAGDNHSMTLDNDISQAGVKRSANAMSMLPEIVPLAPSMKKRKKEREEYIPSMPAIASMLLADPFVVRIILGRILNELRRNVLQGQTIPCSNNVLPSLLQLLHIVRYSKDLCAIRGKKFFIPSAGMEDISKQQSQQHDDDIPSIEAYSCLRHYTPLLLRLILESELDRRITVGGDLHPASQSTTTTAAAIPVVPPITSMHAWMMIDRTEQQLQQPHVAMALLQGSLIHLCVPGSHHTELSLSVSFPKFATALQAMTAHDTTNGLSLLDDRIFFQSLQETIVRHKVKLPRSARDVIVSSWLKWLQQEDATTGNVTATAANGSAAALHSILSPAHEYLIRLLDQWYTFGNVLLPRDTLLRFLSSTVETVNVATFSNLWQQSSLSSSATRTTTTTNDDESSSSNDITTTTTTTTSKNDAFVSIRKQYEHLLQRLPGTVAEQWMGRYQIQFTTTTTVSVPQQ